MTTELDTKRKQKFWISLIWISLVLLLIAGILYALVYEEEVIDYLGYYFGALGFTVIVYIFLTRAILHKKPLKKLSQLAAGFWILIVFGASTYGLIDATPSYTARYFSTSPFLMWGDDQDPAIAITVNWISSFPKTAEVRYGLSPNNLDKTLSNTTKTRYHHFAITGLAPATTYYYKAGKFSVKQFTTAPVGAFNYTFAVWADHRTNTNIKSSHTRPNMVELMSTQFKTDGINPNFAVFCGDGTSEAEDYNTWNTWFDDITYNDWASNQSLAMAYGNHERHGDTTGVTVQNFYPYAPKEDMHFYRSFEYGNAHFIILDPYSSGASWAANFTTQQLAWLEADLAAHTSANFTMIFMHPPAWALGGVKQDLARLSVQYGIDALFCGHNHIFNLRTLNGTRMMTIGLGGNPNNDYSNYPCSTAYARVDVSPSMLQVTAQFTNGTKLADFTIPA